MKCKFNKFLFTVILFNTLLLSHYVSAHVMVAQHGTLNVLGHSVFMVLSLPVSAFEGVDDDNDGKLSSVEFSHHRKTIARVVHKQVILKDQNGKLTLEDMMLSPVVSHQSPKAPVSQIIVMGRYNLSDPLGQLEYKVELFGTTAAEQLLEISANRKSDHKTQREQLSPKNSSVVIF